jgi:hypothetical protein
MRLMFFCAESSGRDMRTNLPVWSSFMLPTAPGRNSGVWLEACYDRQDLVPKKTDWKSLERKTDISSPSPFVRLRISG